MILRLLNFVVIGVLILATAYVYRIKFDSTVQAERLAKIRGEVRRERDAIAALRASWGELDNPTRIEALAKRHLRLQPIAPTQFDRLNQLPERPPQLVQPDSADPIGDVIENFEQEPAAVTGSIWPPAAAPSATDPPTDDPPDVETAAARSGSSNGAEMPATKSGRLDR
jgi:hypothetical protein